MTDGVKKNSEKILIQGLGNDILTDDGIGPKLISDLACLINTPGIEFNNACCGGMQIMEYIQGYEKVIFIDAIRTEKGNPGDVYYFVPSQFRETLHLSSLHDTNFITALELGTNLNMKLPTDLHIIAIEIIEDMEFGEELTLPLREKYPAILEEVSQIIKQIIFPS